MFYLIILVVMIFLMYYFYEHIKIFINDYIGTNTKTNEGFYHHYELKGPMVDTEANAARIMRPLDIKSCDAGITIEKAAVQKIELDAYPTSYTTDRDTGDYSNNEFL